MRLFSFLAQYHFLHFALAYRLQIKCVCCHY